MTTKETIINAIPFPVFAADADGFILYKNRSAMRHIGMMRKGSRMARYFVGGKLPKEKNIAILSVETPYPHALMVADEAEAYFFCFPRLQYPDTEFMAEELLKIFGRTPAEVLYILAEYQRVYGKSRKFPKRMYTELIHLIPQTQTTESCAYALKALLVPLFEKTGTGFSALGYRIHTELDELVLNRTLLVTNRYDFIFFFGRMLYCMMKLSRDGDISISLDADPFSDVPLLRFYTHTDCKPLKNASALDLFSKAAPECAAELFLMGRSAHLRDTTSAFIDIQNGCTLEYRIPYLTSALILHSDVFEESLALPIERELSRIGAMLKGTPSFYRYSSAEN